MPKFKKGQSGNPSGRKSGTSRAAKLLHAIDADLPEVVAAMVECAKSGDASAAKLLLDRSIPAMKPIQPVAHVRGLKDKTLAEQGDLIVVAMGDGSITGDQAQAMLACLTSLSRIREIDDIEQRLQALEKKE